MNVVDSSAWIEFFLAGSNGPVFKPVMEQRGQLLVPVIALFEVHKIISRHLSEALAERCLDIMRLGRVLELTDCRAIAASKVARQHCLTLAGAAMYSMAQEHQADFWTQDANYKNLPGVRYVAKL